MVPNTGRSDKAVWTPKPAEGFSGSSYAWERKMVGGMHKEVWGCKALLKSMRKHLLEELKQTFPDEVEAYRGA
ncbi:Mediator of RNA polymerase II transcription subunit 10a [Acorus calamus]|uniref:Mediator of RNA polymerase II transcription subunit 10a n=1 Tax=Acorus calamus TaxID=4465 RepID=A0AAV9FDX9_ACOCL|nr:Mediator of RNA polymerase II transcription subunit 10a [Acorus calamus]